MRVPQSARWGSWSPVPSAAGPASSLWPRLAQVAGDHQVVIRGLPARVPKVGQDGISGGGGHGGSHIVCILDALVYDLAGGDVGNPGTLTLPTQDDAPGAGDCPLGGRGSLAAVLQRGAVLPLRRAEVGGGHSRRVFPKSTVQQQSGQGQALRHGGAGAVQPAERARSWSRAAKAEPMHWLSRSPASR